MILAVSLFVKRNALSLYHHRRMDDEE